MDTDPFESVQVHAGTDLDAYSNKTAEPNSDAPLHRLAGILAHGHPPASPQSNDRGTRRHFDNDADRCRDDAGGDPLSATITYPLRHSDVFPHFFPRGGNQSTPERYADVYASP